jgi:hypothetical protein
MTSTEFVKEFGDRWQKAVNERRIDALLEMLTKDVRFEDPRLESPQVGHEAPRQIFETDWRAFPDARFTRPPDPYFVSLDGDWGGARWRGEGTMLARLDPPGYAPSNRRFVLEGIDLWRFRDGQAAGWVSVYDLVGSSRQLGFLPPMGSGTERFLVAMQHLSARIDRHRTSTRTAPAGIRASVRD